MGGQGAPIIWDFAPIHYLLKMTKFLFTVCPSNINFQTTSLILTNGQLDNWTNVQLQKEPLLCSIDSMQGVKCAKCYFYFEKPFVNYIGFYLTLHKKGSKI